jgi:hypothetical protein
METKQDGEPIGFSVPIMPRDRRTGHEVLGRLGRLVNDVVCRSGIDEEELVREISASPSQS